MFNITLKTRISHDSYDPDQHNTNYIALLNTLRELQFFVRFFDRRLNDVTAVPATTDDGIIPLAELDILAFSPEYNKRPEDVLKKLDNYNGYGWVTYDLHKE